MSKISQSILVSGLPVEQILELLLDRNKPYHNQGLKLNLSTLISDGNNTHCAKYTTKSAVYYYFMRRVSIKANKN